MSGKVRQSASRVAARIEGCGVMQSCSGAFDGLRVEYHRFTFECGEVSVLATDRPTRFVCRVGDGTGNVREYIIDNCKDEADAAREAYSIFMDL